MGARGQKEAGCEARQNPLLAVQRGAALRPRPCPFSLPCQVCERTAADKKGGHLCRRKSDGKFLLRESAMCPDEDKKHFEDIAKHKWVGGGECVWGGGGGGGERGGGAKRVHQFGAASIVDEGQRHGKRHVGAAASCSEG